jgi:hypothetical protein
VKRRAPSTGQIEGRRRRRQGAGGSSVRLGRFVVLGGSITYDDARASTRSLTAST